MHESLCLGGFCVLKLPINPPSVSLCKYANMLHHKEKGDLFFLIDFQISVCKDSVQYFNIGLATSEFVIAIIKKNTDL